MHCCNLLENKDEDEQVGDDASKKKKKKKKKKPSSSYTRSIAQVSRINATFTVD